MRQNNTTAAPGVALAKPGQITFRFSEVMSSPKIKNISLFQKAKSALHLWPSRPTQRASAVVTDVGRVAVDATVATDERG
jgi:hypothetical protein